MSRLDSRLANFIKAQAPVVDPAKSWPGAPPMFGQMPVDHIFTLAGQTGLAGRAYLNADEAMMHDPENAERMKADCGITESLEARQRATALLKWSVQPEDDSQDAKDLATQMTKVLNRTPRFMELRRNLLEGIWAGKSGTAHQFASGEIGSDRRILVSRWEPRHGDKLLFRYSDGSGDYKPDQVGIRVSSSYLPGRSQSRKQIEMTSSGMVYWLNDFERKTMAVHKHMVEDGPFENPRLAGRIHGVGIRSRIYWTWYAMVECMQRALEYLDRAAFGVEIWRYPSGNIEAKKATEEAAKRMSAGRSIILAPVFPGANASLYGVERMEPGLAGVDSLLKVIKDFFQNKIKRYIMGQILTSEAEATGMGSGVADAHMATFADIVQYDATNLEETLTVDLLRPLQLWNFPMSRGTHLKFVIETESNNVKDRLDALNKAWQMGKEIRVADVDDILGTSAPKDGEDTLFNPQIFGAIVEQRAKKQAHLVAVDQMTQSVMKNLGITNFRVAA